MGTTGTWTGKDLAGEPVTEMPCPSKSPACTRPGTMLILLLDSTLDLLELPWTSGTSTSEDTGMESGLTPTATSGPTTPSLLSDTPVATGRSETAGVLDGATRDTSRSQEEYKTFVRSPAMLTSSPPDPNKKSK